MYIQYLLHRGRTSKRRIWVVVLAPSWTRKHCHTWVGGSCISRRGKGQHLSKDPGELCSKNTCQDTCYYHM